MSRCSTSKITSPPWRTQQENMQMEGIRLFKLCHQVLASSMKEFSSPKLQGLLWKRFKRRQSQKQKIKKTSSLNQKRIHMNPLISQKKFILQAHFKRCKIFKSPSMLNHLIELGPYQRLFLPLPLEYNERSILLAHFLRILQQGSQI